MEQKDIDKHYAFCTDLRELFGEFAESFTIVKVSDDGSEDRSNVNLMRYSRFIQDMEAPIRLKNIVLKHYGDNND